MWQKAFQLNGGGSTPFQFSTEEQKTNLKWIDGKPIYVKVINFTTIQSSSWVQITTLPSDICVKNMYGSINNDSNGECYPLNARENENYRFTAIVSASRSLAYVCMGWGGKTAQIVIEYTKTTD